MPEAGEYVARRYRLVSPLGEGGMGSVWRAEDTELGAPVALKFQHRRGPRKHESRFRREARSAARLRSPHVVRIVDFGIDGQTPYLAMELLEGESLKSRLDRQSTASFDETRELISQVASAIDAAHEAGIVHRDLKPSNLFFARDGTAEIVKLLDFGIAKWADGSEITHETCTESDFVVGSAQYMSPEQTRGEAVDGRADVWALGVVAYQMLSGLLPFRGRNLPDTLQHICAGRFEPLSHLLGATHVGLDPVFERVFALARERRYETASAFATALIEAGSRLPSRATQSRYGALPVQGRESSTASIFGSNRTSVPSRTRRLAGVAAAVATLILLPVTLRFRTTGGVSDAQRAEPAPGIRRAASAIPAVTASEVSLAVGAPKPEPELSGDTPGRSEPARPATTGSEPRTERARNRPREPASSAASSSVLGVASAPPSRVDPIFGLSVPAR